MSLKEAALLAVAASCLLPVAAAYLRHRSGFGWIATLVAELGMACYLGILLQIVRLGADPGAAPWLFALLSLGTPMLVAGYVLAVTMGRADAAASLRASARTLFALGALGAVFLLFLRHPTFITGYTWEYGGGRIHLGSLGKAYLSFLLLGLVVVGYHLESTLRLSAGHSRDRLRPAVLGLFGVLGFFTYVITTGLLHSALETDPLVAGALPILLGNILMAYGFMRGALSDVSVPISRTVVYSSVTAFVAALYVITVGIVAQLATFTRWSPGEAVTVCITFLVILSTLVLIFSSRLQRKVRRFIDRNFYVNRYDYRSQWFRVSRALDPAEGAEGVVRAAATLLKEVFRADAVTVCLTHPQFDVVRAVHGRGAGENPVELDRSSPLLRKLHEERRALMLDRNPEDFEYIRIYVEDREWLDATASRVVAPLFMGQHLVGLVGLERSRPDDRFTFEDLDLLDNLSAQLAAVLRSVQLTADLADAREIEVLSQWSSMLLHDLKNHLSPLRMLVSNMRSHMDNREFQRQAITDIEHVTRNLEDLVLRLSQFKDGPQITAARVDVNRLMQKVMAKLQLRRWEELAIHTNLQAGHTVTGDEALLGRVMENLITNAVQAMRGRGTLSLSTASMQNGGVSEVVISVDDEGPGMSDEFVRKRLFRPFSTTKAKGLGLGLYQCRTIVRAHKGDLRIQTAPGRGTRVRVHLPADPVTGKTALGSDRRASVLSPGRRQ